MIFFFLNQISNADLLLKHFLFSDELTLHFNSLTVFPQDFMKSWWFFPSRVAAVLLTSASNKKILID